MRIAFWLGTATVMVMIGLAATWLFGALDPNGFAVHFLTALAGSDKGGAAIAQAMGRTLHDSWDYS